VAKIGAVDLDLGERRTWGAIDVVLYLVGVAGVAAALTIMWLSMRAVLDIGGYCAEGGPYVIAQHCPDGVAWLLPLSIFGGLGCAALMGWKGAQLGGPYAGLVLLAWPALFISLGWNFLEFALFPPEGMVGIQLGWLIPGVLFVIMGAVPLVGFLPGGKNWQPPPASKAYDFAAEGEARYEHSLNRERTRLLTDLVRAAEQRAAADGPPAAVSPQTENQDLVSKLERLSALYRAGSLSYDEFHRAKAALIAEAGG
jgi:hypothetical protein